MIEQERLHDLTESYLKSVISEAADSLSHDFDSLAAFGELGINSFQVLKIIRKLEDDFGTLPKTLLFENFNVDDLAGYFVEKHEATLAARFAKSMEGAAVHSSRRAPEPSRRTAPRTAEAPEPAPILILEKDAYTRPVLKDLVQTLYARYKIEGSVSRGTRKIAPNLFIGSARRGYFNYGRCKDMLVVYGYTGPRDYLLTLLEEMVRHCAARGLQLNVLAGEQIPPAGGTSFSATPFGVGQRIVNLKEFTLEGGSMRRLRYQVSRFERSGACRTQEYRCGSDPQTDQKIAAVIDRWCETRTAVNPLVRDVRSEILAGTLSTEHRVFLTYLDDVLQNVIVITAMCAEENGYLMDLEFYLPEMPLGGLEFAIVRIIDVLVREGCGMLSLGGTYGCKIESSPAADPEIDRILDDLRERNIVNDGGNLQFKNKFRPETGTIFLCRPVGSGNPGNVIDIIMMIADPENTQTSDEENHNGMALPPASVAPPAPIEAAPRRPAATSEPARAHRGGSAIEGVDRARILAESGFNPLKIPHEHVDFDLKTDSWAQLGMPAIAAQMRHLHGQLQQPVGVNESLRAVFPFAHFVLTPSGHAAEHAFFKAWPKKGIVPQNLLFPSTIIHQIDQGFSPKELPHRSVFQLNAEEPYKGNIDWEALQALVARDPAALSCVCIEVSDNAAGGGPVSIQHLRNVKSLLATHDIPLVLDATRVVENAQFLIEHEADYHGRSLWTAAGDILSCADAVIGSLTKDFCVNKGGIIATNDAGLFHRIEELAQDEGCGIDLIDRKLIALSLQNRRHIEAAVLARMEHVRLLWQALKDRAVPVVQPAGTHCVLIDVRRIAEFKDLRDPVASFLAWLYVNTGIRAAAHSAGMQKHTAINDLVRLAIPVGMKRQQIESVIELLSEAFEKRVNIPEVVNEGGTLQPLGGVYADYQFIRYHNLFQTVVAKTDVANEARPLPAPPEPATSGGDTASSETGVEQRERIPSADPSMSRRPCDVAVIGMAGRYPKAKNLSELWDNLVAGRDCIEEIPPDRYEWRRRHGIPAKYRAGFIDDIDKFDSLFFNISPREAEMVDPQERLFLEVAWEAIEDAGYYPEIMVRDGEPRKIGVFVGAVWAMYQMLGVEEKHAEQPGNPIVPNSFFWSIANRVSYAFNLTGPSMTVDTACSSSLTALQLACEAIQAGQCSAAIVGGVNLDLHQAKYDINHQGGALSEDGVCRTFGKGANGYVMGEGIGALVLKPLDGAVQDGDHIYGVIRSAVVNHGGRTSGYMVPNPKAQAELVAMAIEKAGIDPRSIGYIEAHGTGTELGDPVEIAGLTEAFQSHPVEEQTCAIGSVKTNIGHLEAAAGVVGVTKVLLQMKHRRIVPSLHSAELNELIDFDHSPFYVVQSLEEWSPKEVDGVRLPLRAGVSSFGAGGANAHIIVESYEPAQTDREPVQAGVLIFPLSARNEDQLRQAAVRLASFLGQTDVDLNDAAYTLQQGRKSFEHRLAVVARSKEELIENLTSFAAGQKTRAVATGNAKASEAMTRLLGRRVKQEFSRMLLQYADPHELAGLWAEGLLADWQGVRGTAGKRISLPSYPFAGKRHWIPVSDAVRPLLQPAGMHPMVDSNESTFERQIFKKTFHDGDFFIYDHRVSDIPTLPGVAYLELARKAGEIAAGRKVRKIRNILWISPIAVQNGTPKEVFIELKPSGESVQFEVFSEDAAGRKTPHSQGKLLYETKQEEAAAPESIDLQAVRARCAKVTDGATTYPLFKSLGLDLGPSFQVVQDVYKNDTETLGELKLPEFRQGDLETMVLQPSLVDGSLQAGVAGQLGGGTGEMFVPFSIGEVEILRPLRSHCFSYVTVAGNDGDRGGKSSAVVKSNALIVDETGTVLVKIKESVGVPLRQIYKQSAADADSEGFSTLYYSYDWQKVPLAAEPSTQSHPTSLLLFDTGETRRDLYRERLKHAGANADGIILVRPGEAFEDAGNQAYTVNPRVKEDYVRLFTSLLEKGCSVDNVCFAWPLGQAGQSLAQSLEKGVYAFLFLCQALAESKLDHRAQLVYLYSRTGDEAQPHHEAVSGFVNTLRIEFPRLLVKALEVVRDNAGDGEVLDALWAELQARTQDANVVRYERGDRSIRRLGAFDLAQAAEVSPSTTIREGGVYLITGGAGGLGLLFAEFLAGDHKARVVISGRSPLSAEREARLEELRKKGAEVHYVAADVSDKEDVERLIGECKSRFGAVNGVIHAAGVLRDSMVRNKTPEEMDAVFAPKVYGTVHLDDSTRNDDLDFFVLFSSLAAVAGNNGQSDYSFANAFMDSFAAERDGRRAQGARSGKTLSVNWSIWADGGLKLDEQTELMFRKAAGIKPLAARTGLDAFVKGLTSGRAQFAVLEGLQEKVELAWGLRKKAVPPPAPATAAVSGSGGDLRPWLENELTQIVMDMLKLAADDVPDDKILLELGFDSIGLTTFANVVNEKFQTEITPVLFFDYPSISEIAKYMCVEQESAIRRVHGGPAPGAVAGARPSAAETQLEGSYAETGFAIRKAWNPAGLDSAVPPSSLNDFSPERRFINEPIAVVGMSGVMPQSEDLDEFWENLSNSTDMISVIPEDRFSWEDYFGDPLKEINKTNSKWGGFMKEVDKFDPLFFGISPREASMMDPQQRIFLETVWKAIEDSGQKVSDLSGTRTGLFVGVATSDYTDILRARMTALDGYSASGNSHSVLANRISFLLNLHGPSAPVDTACSSSLVALHRAIESIHTHSCDMAIVGGVQVILSPAAFISFSSAGMLSPDGKCKTFDKRANGYVRGEGVGAILIKRLSAAEADGNHIYGLIKATAENHGGKVTTLTAPNSVAQMELVIEAYEKAQFDPATIGYIECHGTGTSLGDPIEVQALGKAFAELYKRRGKVPAAVPHCGLSAVKSNIGHLETAAGIAGILKVLLAIKNKQIPAIVHFQELNPYISLKETPFYVADKLTPWQAPAGEDGLPLPRRAGISSFGFGGANAHIVFEEYIPKRPQTPATTPGPQLIVLSAKNEDRLKAYVRSMLTYLDKHVTDLADFAYTLQVGRDEMPERLALIASNTDDLKRKFEAVLSDAMPEGRYHNHVKKNSPPPVAAAGEPALHELIERRDLSRLGQLWTSGAKIDWRLLQKTNVPRRISVPSYPFARERYWVPEAEKGMASPRGQAAIALLHPLVHRNTSTLEEQKFSSHFSGREFYLADHVVGTEKILPGVAYMEMARAAGELSGSAKVSVIRNLTWERPLVVEGGGKDVEVSLVPSKGEVRFTVRSGANGSAVAHCTGLLGYEADLSGLSVLDIAAIKARLRTEVVSGKDLYPRLSAAGLNLGRSFQIVQSIYATESESLAILQLPEHLKEDAGQFWLHPALMDGSLHTAMGLAATSGKDASLGLPYAVGEVHLIHPVGDLHYGYATWSDNGGGNRDVRKVNFHLLDEKGRVLVRIKDFMSRPLQAPTMRASLPAPQNEVDAVATPESVATIPEEGVGLQSLLPIWSTARIDPAVRTAVPEASTIVMLGGGAAELAWVSAAYPNTRLLDLAPITVDAIAQKLGDCSFDQLLWIAPEARADEFIEQQEEGVIAVFRIIKALLRLGYASKKLQWTFVTMRTQEVTDDDAVQPAHGGIAGLVGSLAKEYPQWDLRLLDIDSLAEASITECLSLPWDKGGNLLAQRRGEWFRQGLARMSAGPQASAVPQASPVYRQNGVYVVIGGAGGVGEVWSRFMIENHQANIVWIGRRPVNSSIEEKITALAQLGPAPLYVSADAADFNALQQACRSILETYPAIHGVVHSAIVLQDRSIARMEEAVFRAGLSAKVDVSVNLDRVFGDLDLDILLFFSSIVSFVKSPGQSNYAAGSTFKDSFAHALQRRRSYPVKIMNWAYWGNVGVVSDETHNSLMTQMGVGSIEPDEGMAALQVLAGSGIRQMALMKARTSQAMAGLNITETVEHYPRTGSPVLAQVPADVGGRVGKPIAALEAESPTEEMNAFLSEMLASTLSSLGLFREGVSTIAAISSDKRPTLYYERWLRVSIAYLQQRGLLGADLTLAPAVRPLADLWAEWDGRRSAWEGDPSLLAQFALMGNCLRALPEILTGQRLATDVMFPKSSMESVGRLYRDNVVADHFNGILSDVLVASIEQQLATDRQRTFRIIEIGAGTGGTTATLIPALQRLPIAEYCYTDVSRAFLLYGEKTFRAQLPALTTAIFDVTKPLAGQAIAAGRYDFAVAANVLHATPDIRETLRNTKAVLKCHGVLLINEVSTFTVFNHLTFGLLEGWWLHEDTALRLPGTPALAPESWREILSVEGFEPILFPAAETHHFGQQIVAAEGNGWARQRIVKQVAPAPVAVVEPMSRTAAVPSSSAGQGDQRGVDYIRGLIKDKLSEALRLPVEMMANDAPFADFGVDSIIGVNFVRNLSEALQVELETTSLFEYSTVSQLADYIEKKWGDQIAAQLGPAQSAAPAVIQPANDSPEEVELRAPQRFETRERFVVAGGQSDPDESNASGAGREPIAIIGMSGRFAGSESLDAFWENLAGGKNLVKEATRWSAAECLMPEASARAYCSQGSFIDSIDQFDPAFFGISVQEAIYMDPQQRLFLEEAWKALEDAGYAGKEVQEKDCGVYVGCGSSYYDQLATELVAPPQAFWGNSQSIIPARIAYSLNLHGPAIAVDTACSSSLVTIHLACQGLWSRETDMALAGGVFLQTKPLFYQVANQAGMLSPDGKCYSFDARANGFVPGEGVGVVVLKRLRDALRDGDYIHGVIAGSGINQDGRSNGIIAPNGLAQERLERTVYDRFDIDPATIQVIEAHATGSVLGDSVECAALTRSFRHYTDKKQFCALGTVKTNIGHTATAAGVAGVLKVLLSLKHRQIPPSLHYEKTNPAADLESGPFYVNTRLREWPEGNQKKRRAALSAFGFSGTNAHLVIEEAPGIGRIAAPTPGSLIVLSARTAEQLRQQAQNLLAWLKHERGVPLDDVSFSLLTGRMHRRHRLSCVARSQEELIRLLGQWLSNASSRDVYTADVPEGGIREQAALKKFGQYCIQECRKAADPAVYIENLAAVAELYIQGYDLDFRDLFTNAKRIPLPTYPFARERYWMGAQDDASPSASAMAAAPHSTAGDLSNAGGLSYGAGFTVDEELLAWMEGELSQLVRNSLGLDGDADIPLDKVLLDLGFDSVGLTKLAGAINEKYALDITPVLFFEYPSVAALATYLSVEREDRIRPFYKGLAAAPRFVPRPAPLQRPVDFARSALIRSPRRAANRRSGVDDPIAIVGISGVMPQSDDLEAFWENLKNGKDLVTVIPDDRWRWEDYYGDPFKEPNKTNSKWGGFIRDVDKFDPLFFGISPREAEMMDPQQRIFLETVWKAIEDSGQKVSDLSGTRTALFVGVASNDYIEVLRSTSIPLDGYSASGNTNSVLANRVSFLLDLHGPSSPIDTACSSSLVALHRAVESIHSGSCEMAIVGGVQIILSPAPYIAFSVAGMLSSDGKCRAFDKNANGYVRSEGAGALFLKPLSAAEADGNHIYAIIKATAENHGGRATTLTAPNVSAQSALLVEAYEKAQIDPATVGYIECHGTGTSLGDPIEAQALSSAFAELYKKRNKVHDGTPRCGLGSVKTNAGHMETAAGIAGVLKVLLAMKHKQLPANIHFQEINPYVNLGGTPFYVVDKLTPWTAPADNQGRPLPRRAGVSSFGFGGANAHVVLEEYISLRAHSAAALREPQLIVVSAKNHDRLQAYVRSLHEFLGKGEVDLLDLAYTLQAGRDEMPERLALVAASTDELRQKFAEILNGGRPQDSYRNRVRERRAGPRAANGPDKTLVEALVDRKELSKLGECWVAGAKIDWLSLHPTRLLRRISVPTYPFARERHWPAAEPRVANVRQDRPSKPLDGGATSEDAGAGLHSFVSVWNPLRLDANKRIVLPETTGVLLLGGDRAHLDWVRRSNPNAQHLPLDTSSIDVIEQQLRDRSFDQLLWIAPDVACDGALPDSDSERMIDQQEQGVLSVFRIIKALLRSDHTAKALQWTLVIGRTQPVTDEEPVRAAHAGIAGLIGSLAKECPHWDLRLLDVDSLASLAAGECFTLPWDKQGNVLAHRHGEWFQQSLARMASQPPASPAGRGNGVYVVIGGAGGVGEVWSRFMIEQYQANVVWIGRRELDAAIEEKIRLLSQFGPAPLYISADATDEVALRRACTAILQTYPVIHGVVHSAIVLQDQSLARMEESVFRDSLSAKVDVSVNMDRVFGALDLDFMLFFSSIVSFIKSGGQSNYAAGCTFKDSFAHELQQRRAYPVKVMNWGYWGRVGVVADESHNRAMAQIGIGSIEADEGMASLQVLAGSAMRQMALVKTLRSPAAAGLTLSETVAYYTESAPDVLPDVGRSLGARAPGAPIADLEAAVPAPEMLDFMTEILASSLVSMGLFPGGIHTLAQLDLEKRPAPYFERWLSTSIRYLQEQNVLGPDLTLDRGVRPLADLWSEWEEKRTTWAAVRGMQALIPVLEACLRALPEILTAKQLATNVLFPNSSMHLVEGVYHDNVVAHHFNAALTETLVACIEQQLRAEPKRRIRIMEIGAGTGGTTAKLLPALQRFSVAEYRYTDLSRAFLMYAEKLYQPGFPALTTGIFDVSKPLAPQSVAAGHYDFAIAANVLHATADIRETLRNAKAVLKNQGVLLLNEISTWSLFNHVTFGLLEGWWLHEDSAMRIPGSPGLTTEAWRSVLAEEGFESVFFPVEPTHKFGYQIIAAASNGRVRQRIPVKTSRPPAVPKRMPTASSAGKPVEQAVRDHVQQVINEKLSEALKLDAAEIGGDAPFANYGVDSISGVMLIRAINEALAIEVEPSTLLEYSTVDELTEYIISMWPDQIAMQLGPTEAPPQQRDRTELPGPSEAVMDSIDAPAEDGLGPTAAEPQRSNKVATGGPRIEINKTIPPENILWQETSSLEDGYEKVTF